MFFWVVFLHITMAQGGVNTVKVSSPHVLTGYQSCSEQGVFWSFSIRSGVTGHTSCLLRPAAITPCRMPVVSYGISAVAFLRPPQLETCCQEFPAPFLDVSHQRFSASGYPDTILQLVTGHTKLTNADQTISAENLEGSDLLVYLRVDGRKAKRVSNKD